MTGIDRGRLIQERWFTVIRWFLIEAFFLALHLGPDLPGLFEVRPAPIFVGFAAYTLLVTFWVMIRRTWPIGLAHLTATLDCVFAAAAAGSWTGEVVTPGLLGTAIAGIGVGVRRLPLFETVSYGLILVIVVLGARFAFTLQFVLDQQAAVAIGIVAFLPVLVRACVLDPRLSGEDAPMLRLSTRGMGAVREMAPPGGGERPVLFHAAAASLASYTESPVAGVVVHVDETKVDLYTVADGEPTVANLTEQVETRFGPRLIALPQPAILDERERLDPRGLPAGYPTRLRAIVAAPIVDVPDLRATLFALNPKRGSFEPDDLVTAVLLSQETGRRLLLRDLVLTAVQARASATESLLAAAEAKRAGSRYAAEECARFAVAIARELGWEEIAIEELRLAALLHDVGELAIPDPLLDKPNPLTPEEFEIVRQHPRHAARIIDYFNRSKLVLDAVFGHHERWDGRGYPSALAGESIPQGARILCLADAMESMLSSKVYRPDLTPTGALQEVLLGSGTQFDPSVVQAFLAVLRREGESFLEHPGRTEK